MTKTEAAALKKALEIKFGGQAEFEAVNGHGRYRFVVTSQKFDVMPNLKRQDEVWKIVDKILSKQASLDVSLILAYAPTDLAPSN